MWRPLAGRRNLIALKGKSTKISFRRCTKSTMTTRRPKRSWTRIGKMLKNRAKKDPFSLKNPKVLPANRSRRLSGLESLQEVEEGEESLAKQTSNAPLKDSFGHLIPDKPLSGKTNPSKKGGSLFDLASVQSFSESEGHPHSGKPLQKSEKYARE